MSKMEKTWWMGVLFGWGLGVLSAIMPIVVRDHTNAVSSCVPAQGVICPEPPASQPKKDPPKKVRPVCCDIDPGNCFGAECES